MIARPGVTFAMAMLAVGCALWWVRDSPKQVGPEANGWSLTAEEAPGQGAGDRPGDAVGRGRGATPAAVAVPLIGGAEGAGWPDALSAEPELADEAPVDLGEPFEVEGPEFVAAVVADEGPIDIDDPLDADDPLDWEPEDPSFPDSELGDFLDADDPSSSQVDLSQDAAVEIGGRLDVDAAAGY